MIIIIIGIDLSGLTIRSHQISIDPKTQNHFSTNQESQLQQQQPKKNKNKVEQYKKQKYE